MILVGCVGTSSEIPLKGFGTTCSDLFSRFALIALLPVLNFPDKKKDMASQKIVTLEELRDHKTKDSLYVLIHGKGECGPIRVRVFVLADFSSNPQFTT